MTVPKVTLNRLDNQLGVAIQTAEILALCGQSAGGPLNTCGVYARKQDVISTFVDGPLVEAACYEIEWTGKPVVLCRTDKTTAGAVGTITFTGTGSSVVTAHAGVEPRDDYEVLVTIVNGCTVGITGGTYTYSLDGGRTTSLPQAIGTLTSITLPGSVGVQLDLAAGNLAAGDTIAARTTAPKWNAAQLAAGLLALQNTSNRWDICEIVDPVVSSSEVTVIEAAAIAMEAVGKERAFVWSFRIPTAAETEATYKTAFDTAFSAVVSNFSIDCAGAAWIQSPISQRRYLRRIAMDIGPALVSVRPGIDIAAKKLGPRPPAVRILDDANNPLHHDELLNPGLDDSRATTYRSWDGSQGVYVNNARVLSTAGSDFTFAQHLRVMNVACTVIRRVLTKFASDDVTVNATTGFILEEDARAIENEVNSALDTELIGPGDASAASFVLNRNDNILATFTLKGSGRIVPKGYIKFFNVDVGFLNPAMNIIQQAA